MSTNGTLNRKLRMALVGGGQGAFIGRVHATAAVLDNRAALVAGALSSDPAKAKASAADYDIPADRAYGSYRELIDKENGAAGRPAGRLHLDRHAEPHALRNRQGGGRSGFQRHLRQADDVRPRPGRGTGRHRRSLGRGVRRHAQLHRLSARAAGPADDSRRRVGRDQRRPRRSTSRAGCARGWKTEHQKQAALADRSGQAAAPPAASATSARMPTIWPAT